jgi:hypothetical protein
MLISFKGIALTDQDLFDPPIDFVAFVKYFTFDTLF